MVREFFLPEDVGEQERRDGRVAPGETCSPQGRTAPRGPEGRPPGVGHFQPEGAPGQLPSGHPQPPRAGPSGLGSRHLLFQPPSTRLPMPNSRTPLGVKTALSTLASPQP